MPSSVSTQSAPMALKARASRVDSVGQRIERACTWSGTSNTGRRTSWSVQLPLARKGISIGSPSSAWRQSRPFAQ